MKERTDHHPFMFLKAWVDDESSFKVVKGVWLEASCRDMESLKLMPRLNKICFALRNGT